MHYPPRFSSGLTALLLLLLIGCESSPVRPTAVEVPRAAQPIQQTAKWAEAWWLPRHQSKVEEAQKGAVDLIFIGDSITHGWEKEKSGLPMWTQYYQHMNALNLGFGGDRTEHVLWRLQNGAIDDIAPKVAVLLIGTNNTGQKFDDADDTALAIKTIIAELQQRLPLTKVLLLAILPMKLLPDDNHRKLNVEVNRRIAKLADGTRVFFLDIGGAYVDDKGVLNTLLMPDRLHLTTEGYRLWAEAMAPLLHRLMR